MCKRTYTAPSEASRRTMEQRYLGMCCSIEHGPYIVDFVLLSNKHANVLLFWRLELSHSLASTLLQDYPAIDSSLFAIHLSIVAFHPEFWTIPHNSCLNYSWLSFHQTLRVASSGPHPGHTDVNYGYWIIHISPFIFHLINHVWCLSLSRAVPKSQRSVYLHRI